MGKDKKKNDEISKEKQKGLGWGLWSVWTVIAVLFATAAVTTRTGSKIALFANNQTSCHCSSSQVPILILNSLSVIKYLAIELITHFNWCAFAVIKTQWSGYCTLIGPLVCGHLWVIIWLEFLWFCTGCLKFNCDCFFCMQDSVKYTGMIEDCCCDFETVDSVNGEVLHPLLKQLVTTPFFRYFKVW